MVADVVNKYPIWSREVRANPQAIYEQMRQHDPIWRATGPVTGNHIWILVNHADVIAALKHPHLINNVRNLPDEHRHRYVTDEIDPVWEAINRHLLNVDPPDHTRLRALVHKAFTPRRVQALVPRIEAIADDLLAKMGDSGATDLINAYAFPLPITVIAEMLGVDAQRRDDFRDWTKAILFGMDEAQGRAAVMNLVQYVNELIDERETDDKGDILSALVRAEEDGDKLDRMELISMAFLLLVAGHETTVNLIGNGMLTLMQHPQQMGQLRSQPDLIRTAVEELLRWNGPVETPTPRYAAKDVTISGVTISQGDIVLPSLLAANRDPQVFENPNTLDLTRDPNPHIAFGHGIHYCVGAPLARLEGAIALNKLLARYDTIELNAPVEKLEWTPTLLIHGLQALPITYAQ